LDYDGTLTVLCAHPAQARLSPEMRWAISACADRPDTEVTIVSGRALADVADMVNHTGITYVGNHGLEISGPGLVAFRHRDLPHFRTAVETLAATLSEVACDGAWVEAKGPTLTFHYRAAPPHRHAELAARARVIIGEAGFQARDAHAAVEARPPIGWDKGQAVLHVLRERYGPGWARRTCAVYVGDDNTDEDVFRVLAGIGVTFRVGPPGTPTGATHRLDDVAGVQALLEWVAARAAAGRKT
jgi:trehalose-phosphatase